MAPVLAVDLVAVPTVEMAPVLAVDLVAVPAVDMVPVLAGLLELIPVDLLPTVVDVDLKNYYLKK
jgi:hypothetical protein